MQELREFYYWKHRDSIKEYFLSIIDERILRDAKQGKDASWGKDATNSIEDAFQRLEDNFREKKGIKKDSSK